MYKVHDKQFDSFEDVIEYACDTLNVTFTQERELTEAEKQEACAELEKFIDYGREVYMG